MRSPGIVEHPDHKLETERLHRSVEVRILDDLVLRTEGAIRLSETDDSERIYVPINDLTDIDLRKAGDYHCPFKGRAEIYDVEHAGKTFKNAAWSYVEPFDEVQELQGRVAFMSEKNPEIHVL